MFAGALLTRGLGSPLLVTRGLGGFALVITVPVERPRQLRTAGRSSLGRVEREERVTFFVNARLVIVNGQELPRPIEESVRVTYGLDQFRVTSALPSVHRRPSGLTASARLLRIKGPA